MFPWDSSAEAPGMDGSRSPEIRKRLEAAGVDEICYEKQLSYKSINPWNEVPIILLIDCFVYKALKK